MLLKVNGVECINHSQTIKVIEGQSGQPPPPLEFEVLSSPVNQARLVCLLSCYSPLCTREV